MDFTNTYATLNITGGVYECSVLFYPCLYSPAGGWDKGFPLFGMIRYNRDIHQGRSDRRNRPEIP